MRSRRSLLLVAAVGCVSAGLAFYLTSRTSIAAAEVRTAAAQGSQGPAFFGDLLSRNHDYVYQSLLGIYRDRYVPQPISGGHFGVSQSGEASRKANKQQDRSRRQVDEPTPTAATPFSLLSGQARVDPDVDSSPGQRQIEPDVVAMIGPVSQDKDLRDLPYLPPGKERDGGPLRRHPPAAPTLDGQKSAAVSDPAMPFKAPSAPSAMPTPIQTFAGVTSATSGCGCLPPDTDGDVGRSHYIQSVNSSIQIFNKTGTSLAGPTTYNSFFSALGAATPCGDGLHNDGDGIAFYDHVADRWVVSDFAFANFPGVLFYQCIGVSKTSDPVAGGWWLYAVQVDPANPTYLGDYPKFGMWPDAYYMSVNEFSNNTTFNGVRVYAFDRNSMINGNPANTVAFSVLPADLGDQYSFVPSSFRTGSPPPAGRPNMFMDVNSSTTAGTVETQVFVRRFHVDFATPANSTFGADPVHHAPDGIVTVNGFVDAFTTTTLIVPQNGTTRLLDTLGDKLMYPLVYQNRNGTESIYADQTVNNNQGGTGPTAIRWYQFNVTGNTIPAAPAQQQTFNNAADGLWRFMPSINVDRIGNMVIGYSASSATAEPSIRYAGRLAGDPASTLAQGEVVMQAGAGHQTSSSGRWGDYSTMFVDPNDACTFFHTNEYYTATGSATWATRVGSFAFPSCNLATAAAVGVSGRVLTADGSGLRNARVTMTDPNGRVRTVMTGAFGYYHFDNVESANYVVGVTSRKYAYQPRVVAVNDELADVDFTPQP